MSKQSKLVGQIEQARRDAKRIFGCACECSFLSLNTGLYGQCERCGKPLPMTVEHWREIALAVQDKIEKLSRE